MTIERISTYFATLATAISEAPDDLNVWTLQLMTREEREMVLHEFNKTRSSVQCDYLRVHDLVAR